MCRNIYIYDSFIKRLGKGTNQCVQTFKAVKLYSTMFDKLIYDIMVHKNALMLSEEVNGSYPTKKINLSLLLD